MKTFNNEKYGWFFLRVGFFLFIFFIWEFLVIIKYADPFYISSPSMILNKIYLWFSEGSIYAHIFVTMYEAVIGLIIGTIIGISLAAMLINSNTLKNLFLPIAIASNSVPKYALSPLFILWFGLGYFSKITLVVTVVFFSIFITSYEGMLQSNSTLHNHLKMLGAKRWDIIKYLSIPSAMPWFLNGIRMSVGFSISAAVISEFLGASKGLGFLIEHSQSYFDSTGVFAGLFILVGFALPMDYLLKITIDKILKWKTVNQNINTI